MCVIMETNKTPVTAQILQKCIKTIRSCQNKQVKTMTKWSFCVPNWRTSFSIHAPKSITDCEIICVQYILLTLLTDRSKFGKCYLKTTESQCLALFSIVFCIWTPLLTTGGLLLENRYLWTRGFRLIFQTDTCACAVVKWNLLYTFES